MNIQIIDVTLRDGSYAVNFQFSPIEIGKVIKKLVSAGLHFIEVGHGLGIGAYRKFPSSMSDADTFSIARKYISNAKFGVFCLVDIAEQDDLHKAIDGGIGFIRIGVEPHKLKNSMPFIKIARKAKILTSVFLMKSHMVNYKKFADIALQMEYEGVDFVTLADSTGGMLPDEIQKYFEYTINKTSIDLSFHGHDNLGLAVANTLKAVQSGCKYIDTSIYGIGRSAGNAPTEIMIFTLKKAGFNINLDPLKISVVAYSLRDIIHSPQRNSLSAITGYAKIHSSLEPLFQKIALEYAIDIHKLILETSEHFGSLPNESQIRDVALKLSD